MTSGRIKQLAENPASESREAGLVRLVDELGDLVARSQDHPQTRLSSIETSLTALQDGLARGALASSLADLKLLIEEIRTDTETAANAIMDACEAIQNGKSQDAALSDIFTACGFQDIVGQRCDKAGQLLDIAANGPLPADMTESRAAEKNAGLLDGPSGQQDKPSQDDIDKLFSDSGVG
tara:strand:- start:71637 stop:72176 length:540 start_codon:yes stop_codon:yes gene_type:complete